MKFDTEKYKAMRLRSGATEVEIEAELAELAGGQPDNEVAQFTEREIEIAKNIVGSEPEALKKHLNSLAAYKRGRANELDAARRR